MKSEWRSLYAYTSSVNAILLEAIGPFFEARAERLEHGFWERHYAGGPHVRIRLRAGNDTVDDLAGELRKILENWVDSHKEGRDAPYSVARATELLRKEGVDPSAEDLEYRQGVVLERPYPEPHRPFASIHARRLMEDFRRARGPIALMILRAPESLHESVLKLFLVVALLIGRGSYPRGSVAFKSHWSGFAATCPSDTLLDRIEASFRGNRERYLALGQQTYELWGEHRFATDPMLESWWRVLEMISADARRLLLDGHSLSNESPSSDDIAAARDRLFSDRVKRENHFLEALLANPSFLFRAQRIVEFQLPRALVNLLYDLVAAVGLSPLEKMALCHHSFRLVEEKCDCNLDDQLLRSIDLVLGGQVRPVARTTP